MPAFHFEEVWKARGAGRLKGNVGRAMCWRMVGREVSVRREEDRSLEEVVNWRRVCRAILEVYIVEVGVRKKCSWKQM